MRKRVRERIVKLKSQPKWVARVLFGFGAVAGLILALHIFPISGSNAQGRIIISHNYDETVTYTLNRQTFSAGTITITDGEKAFTMLDRNLGATTGNIRDDGSFGYHFQWGNNYGFASCARDGCNTFPGRENVSTMQVDTTRYGPGNWYNQGTFISGYTDWSRPENNDLRGGNLDDQRSNRGFIIKDNIATNATGRQGPCPDGYHVPSIGEWGQLLEFWADYKGVLRSVQHDNELSYIRERNIGYDFQNDFQIPFDGYRDVNGNVHYRSDDSDLWSSSPYTDNESARSIKIDGDDVSAILYNKRGEARSIRCFKDVGDVNACPDGWHMVTGDICVTSDKDIVIRATAVKDEQTLTINKYFANAYTVDWGDGTTGNLTSQATHTYATEGTYNIILSLSGANRWTFKNDNRPLVPGGGTTMTGVEIIYMPSLAEGFGDSINSVGNYFFSSFNNGGSLTSLPEGSFDTSNITSVGNYFFSSFNNGGSLTSLPEGSFRLSTGLTVVGINFFSSFNNGGSLTSLPAGSFDTSNITSVGNYFFSSFNNGGSLTSLPEGSFRLSTGLIRVENSFFESFNNEGNITSLPIGSFDTSQIKVVGDTFFSRFNNGGSLTSLPIGSFDTSYITTVGGGFFAHFNNGGSLTSLPSGSFKLSTGLIRVENSFFESFNNEGNITSLPIGSFDTSQIKVVGDTFFASFNNRGNITSLPIGSFNTSNITSAGKGFFDSFNSRGAIIDLPESFTISLVGASVTDGYRNAFNSPRYTFNKNVSELLSGVRAPSDDRDTFSDNQPKRCGVDPNWLETTADACSITYNYNGGDQSTVTKTYTADTSLVGAGSGITAPTRFGFAFDGWYTSSTGGVQIQTVTFPTMDGQTLYAQWICAEGTHLDGDICVSNTQTVSCIQSGAPANAAYVSGTVTITRNGSGWSTPANCDWLCVPGYHTEDNLSCIENWQEVNCTPVQNPDPNANYSTTGIITWDNGWSSSPLCPIQSCNFGYDLQSGACVVSKNIIIEATATEANKTLKINKYFSNAYMVDRGDGVLGNVNTDKTHTYSASGTYNITLSLTGGATRWGFNECTEKPLIPISGTTMGGVAIIYMPSLAKGFGTSSTNPGNCFFRFFNRQGAITRLPEGSFTFSTGMHTVGDSFFSLFNAGGRLTSLPSGSFDTSYITNVGYGFFAWFNWGGRLTSLPDGSFNISQILGTVDDYFFSYFNNNGKLTSLPSGSFDTSSIMKAGSNFFSYFNYQGEIAELPPGSFNISNVIKVGNDAFSNFNFDGNITNLPTGSFDTSSIITVGNSFFSYFNQKGALTSLPAGSFTFSGGLKTVGDNFFSNFNYSGKLTSLPSGSFNTSNIRSAGNSFFSYFNFQGKLTSLPSGSFNTSNIRSAGNSFFSYFNYGGKITSLPTNSFNISNLTGVGSNFFSYFNYGGSMTSLPAGSFNTSNITTAGSNFFAYFNKLGKITNLPASFTMSSVGASVNSGYRESFDSSNYTLNRNVSDLVSGVVAPGSDRNTFSDNQPGRCGVRPNWLVSTADACSITYDSNGGSTIANPTQLYTADTTSVVAGFGISTPTRANYAFDGWYNASVGGTKITTVTFPSMDSGTLYAHWREAVPPMVTISSEGSGMCVASGTVYTVTGTFSEAVTGIDASTLTVNGGNVEDFHMISDTEAVWIVSAGGNGGGNGIVHDLGSGIIVTYYPDSNVEYTLNGNEHFTAGTITIIEGDDTITILDRNLGATAAGTGLCEDSTDGYGICFGEGKDDPTYGYHFQWGNNYGFKPCTDDNGCSTFGNSGTISDTQIPSDIVNPGYTSGVFVVGYENWVNSNDKVDLWGGSTGDTINSLSGDNWKVTNATERQGPCPSGFHVPSYGELLKIKDMLGNNSSIVRNELLVPFAGYRSSYGAEVYDVGVYTMLWSSSPSESSYFPSLSLNRYGGLDMYYNNVAGAFSVRCVYNSYDTYTKASNLPSEGGVVSVMIETGAFEDLAGNTNTTGSNTISWNYDQAGPTGSIDVKYNGNDNYASGTTLNLILDAQDLGCNNTVSKMQFSCDGTSWSTLENFVSSKNFSLSNYSSAGCTTADGEKTIYVRYVDGLENTGESYSDTITVDLVRPEEPRCAPVSACFSGSSPTITCSTTSSDGVVRFTTSGAPTCNSSLWSDRIVNRTATFNVIACDEAGNASSSNRYTYTLDDMAPDVPVMERISEYTQGLSIGVSCSEVRDNGCDGKVEYQFCMKSESVLRSGPEINDILMELGAGGIDSIERTDNEPGKAPNVVELGKIEGDIQAWYAKGTIYIHTKGDVLKLPENSRNMFANMDKLQSINLGNIDTSSVTNVEGMFAGCKSLSTLELGQFDTSNVTNMAGMFAGDEKLQTIYVSDKFVVGNDVKSSDMFLDCKSIVGGNGTTYDKNYIDAKYARIDSIKNKGYFTRSKERSPKASPSDDGFGCEKVTEWTDEKNAKFLDLGDGQTYTYYVRSRDGLGNTSEWSSGVTSIQDNSSPVISFNRQSGSVAALHSVVVTVRDTVSHLSANQRILYNWQRDNICSTSQSDYKTALLSPTAAGSESATATITTRGLADGNYYLCILAGTVRDQVGNSNIAAVTMGSFEVDSTAPSVIISSDGSGTCITGNTYIVTGVFSELVTGIDASTLTVTNGTVQDFQMVSGNVAVWTVSAGQSGNLEQNATGVIESMDGEINTLTICDPNNLSSCITLMDRNLGADTNDVTSTGSYGYRYQWGNNYGFSDGCWTHMCSDTVTSQAITAKAIWNESYNHSGYYGMSHIKINEEPYDYWEDGLPHDGLRGGEYDTLENNLGFDILSETASNRQGPCPDGYHVPSAGEWGMLIKYWAETNDISYRGNSGEYSLNTGFNDFVNDFKLPYGGTRFYYSVIIGDQVTKGSYWSSTPNGSTIYRLLTYKDHYKYPDDVELTGDSMRVASFNMRCFKNPSFGSIGTISVIIETGAFEDLAGNANTTGSNTITWGYDQAGPNGTIDVTYNGGDTYATGTTLSLALRASDEGCNGGVSGVQFSCDGINRSAVEPFAINKIFTLENNSSLGCTTGDGNKTIYARFFDGFGNSGVAVSDSIRLNRLGIVLQATATEAGQTLKINKYFSNAFTVDWGDGITGNLTAATKHTYGTAGTYNITLSLSGASRWKFRSVDQPLVPKSGTTMTGVKIIYMPSLAEGFGNSATAPGTYFFFAFNQLGAIISLPEGSFDTSNITTAGEYFFGYFNNNGSLTSLPAGSFDLSNITTVGPSFFRTFNQNGSLISLPDGSFRLSTGLTSVGNYFFAYFNIDGNLSSLPDGSFNLGNLSSVGANFFYSFNNKGKLTSLPAGSFDISSITTVGNGFFTYFNHVGRLTSLPTGSFDISNITGTIGNSFFLQFNSYGSLTSLPAGSFDTSNITSVGNYFFYAFNYSGLIEHLPEGSFDLTNITTVGSDFFSWFNGSGNIVELPEGSFNMSNIMTAGNNFFNYFNYLGAIEIIPNSFKLSSVGVSLTGGYYASFNSPDHTINKGVYDLLSGIVAPLDDRDTFSDNQPKRCGVHENWLVTTADACSMIYDSNGGNPEITTVMYTADTTGVAAGSGVTTPTRLHSQFVGWYTGIQTGSQVTTVLFPVMDSGTLYAYWDCDTGYTLVDNECVDISAPTVVLSSEGSGMCVASGDVYVVTGVFTEAVTGINEGTLTVTNGTVEDFQKISDTEVVWMVRAGNQGNLVNSGFAYYGSGTITICNPNDEISCITIMDRNLGAVTNDITSTGSYGYHYQRGNNYGFKPCDEDGCSSFPGGETFTTNQRIDTSAYGPGNYYNSNIFRKITNSPYDWQISENRNMWGGSGDNISNGYGLFSTNPITDRQGPCATGYHVPSIGEWSQLLEYWTMNYNEEGFELNIGSYSGLNYIGTGLNDLASAEAAYLRFRNDFYIPYDGVRDYYDNSIIGLGWANNLLSSSHREGFDFRSVHIFTVYKSTFGSASWNDTAGASAVRCFKDVPIVPSDGSTVNVLIKTGAFRDIEGNRNVGSSNLISWEYDVQAPDVPTIVEEPEITLGLTNEVYSTVINDNGCEGSVLYQFCRSTVNNTDNCVLSDWSSVNSAIFTGLIDRTKYYYFVRVKDGYGNISAWSTGTYSTQANAFTITYSTSGIYLYDTFGNNQNTNIFEYTVEDDLTLYTNFRSGYTFNGWDVDKANSSGSWLAISGTITDMHIGTGNFGNVVLKYNSTGNPYTLYIADSNCTLSPNINELSVIYGKNLNASGTTLSGQNSLPIASKYGYTFKGYAKQSGGALILQYKNNKVSPAYQFNDSNFIVDHINSESTIYPVFQAKNVTIVYHDNVNGNSNKPNNPYGSTVILANPQAANHTFLGWYTAETGGSFIANGGTSYIINTETTPIHMYGRWTCNSGYVSIAEACMPEFEDIDAYFIRSGGVVSNITLMDRNLGAINSDITNTGSYGYHYQWGNNHGFESCYTIGCNNFPGGEEVTSAQVNLSATYNNNPSTYSYRKFVSGYNNWAANNAFTNLWGGSGDSQVNEWGLSTITAQNVINRKGPCPEGYHVPSIGEWGKVLEYRAQENDVELYDEDGLFYYDEGDFLGFQEDFKIPFAGRRDNTNAKILEIANGALFWSSSPGIINERSSVFHMYSYEIYTIGMDYRSMGLSLRCFKDSYISGPGIIVDSNGGENAMILVNGDTISTLESPSRAHSVFEGWYSTSAFTVGTEISTGDTAPAVLYAKWSCSTGYHQSGDTCVISHYSITFVDGSGVEDDVTWSGEYGTQTTGLVNYPLWTKTGYTLSWSRDIPAIVPAENTLITGYWTARNGIPYFVYHYLKDPGLDTYSLYTTEELSGTADSTVILVDLAKDDIPCVTYTGGALIPPNPGLPPGFITSTVISPDGSRKIYLYYIRNKHSLTLTKDSNISSVSGDGVYECGENVMIQGFPDTGYHFNIWEGNLDDSG